MIIEKVGVNRAPSWIHQSGQVRDSGRDTFENENLKKKKSKESQYMVSHPETGSDSPIGSDQESGSDNWFSLFWF